MWFLSKFVDKKNKEAWAAQASINENLFSAIDVCIKHVDKQKDMYFDEIKQISDKVRDIELKLENKGTKK